VTAELLELSRASGQRPRREGHAADDTTRDDPSRSTCRPSLRVNSGIRTAGRARKSVVPTDAA
jgi:hypothetical protein